MTNTEKSFADKWNNNQDLAYENTLKEGSEIQNWILNRNGWKNLTELKAYLGDKKRILDAGCGNGRVTKLMRDNSDDSKTQVVGIDLVAHKVAQANLEEDLNVTFFEKDLLGGLKDLGEFDFIYSQEVLHHTADPKQAFSNLVKLLSEDGEIAIYVYKEKAPIREYTDDYIRERISKLDYDQAMIVSDQITQFGKALSDLDVKVNIPRVDVLDIDEGEYEIQRLFYHFFMKCFWNDELTFKENSVINYDWYHPQDCTRHTLEEIEEWFSENNLQIVQKNIDYYGITMRGKKK